MGHRKNYIRYNLNYIRPFSAVCKPLGNKNLQAHFRNRQTLVNQPFAIFRDFRRNSHFPASFSYSISMPFVAVVS